MSFGVFLIKKMKPPFQLTRNTMNSAAGKTKSRQCIYLLTFFSWIKSQTNPQNLLISMAITNGNVLLCSGKLKIIQPPTLCIYIYILYFIYT